MPSLSMMRSGDELWDRFKAARGRYFCPVELLILSKDHQRVSCPCAFPLFANDQRIDIEFFESMRMLNRE